MKIAIVVSEFNSPITEKMLESALRHAEKIGVEISHVVKVPGSYDMPIAVKRLLSRDDVDAVVTLGAIIKGETRHDEVIAHALAHTLHELSITYDKPVALGVAGPGLSWEQAEARIDEYATRALNAAIKMVNVLNIYR
ncbi:MAG TPA: 6,7-dimethyl-8-ribityllumazine synthase [Candidatus Caldiarchaeum subterraneum]|uniref:6,7-dimethyl-8-ribityllumazine synthase n=1 Tax=Caldiarchaeum subterraneum TaxID=311458 RepID=A0A832ZWP7_CALS0|nr:6,7-dimethyl-8-ribityllumazine synthase [Aigarchaeota archaeon]HIQ29856.1 6,7-dimethyl-8-ribityllumazine synthase [Candidatus Caldarchaeum subterraneum]